MKHPARYLFWAAISINLVMGAFAVVLLPESVNRTPNFSTLRTQAPLFFWSTFALNTLFFIVVYRELKGIDFGRVPKVALLTLATIIIASVATSCVGIGSLSDPHHMLLRFPVAMFMSATLALDALISLRHL
ncbi:MAG: hypothetical protein ACT4N2_08345 [Hyphomicrobium sp.]